MATATIDSIDSQRQQFSGVFSLIWKVRATVDYDNIPTNSIGIVSLSIPGLRQSTDIVLGFNRSEATDAHGTVETVHVHDDTLHFGMHNTTGGGYNPQEAAYTVVIGRLT